MLQAGLITEKIRIFIAFLFYTSVSLISYLFPRLGNPVKTQFKKESEEHVAVKRIPYLYGDEFLSSIFGWAGFKEISSWYFYWLWHKQAIMNGKAPNVKLLHVDGKTESSLFEFMKQGRPLVINFGNCS